MSVLFLPASLLLLLLCQIYCQRYTRNRRTQVTATCCTMFREELRSNQPGDSHLGLHRYPLFSVKDARKSLPAKVVDGAVRLVHVVDFTQLQAMLLPGKEFVQTGANLYVRSRKTRDATDESSSSWRMLDTSRLKSFSFLRF